MLMYVIIGLSSICIILFIYIIKINKKYSFVKDVEKEVQAMKDKLNAELEEKRSDARKKLELELNDLRIRTQMELDKKNCFEKEVQAMKDKLNVELEEKRSEASKKLAIELNELKEKNQVKIDIEKNSALKQLYEFIENELLKYKLYIALTKLLHSKVTKETIELERKEEELKLVEEKFKGYNYQIVNKIKEISELSSELNLLKKELNNTKKEIDAYDVGFYEEKYKLENSKLYKEKLDEIRHKQKDFIYFKNACKCETRWAVGNSITKGESMVNRNIKLMLRAFNGECDSIIANVSYKNINSMERRIDRVYKAINELGKIMDCRITDDYYTLKKQELNLVYEYQEKLYQEKEEQRIIKQQMAEEMKAHREFEKALLEAEKEAERYNKALELAKYEINRATGKRVEELQARIKELEKKVDEAEANKRAISQAQLTKSGYVYIISNIGSFGENVYKVGMTRRLEPYDRIIELNGPSVPFRFDIHAMIFSKNAPELELKIHKKLFEKRLNRINLRKEFFEATLNEIEKIVKDFGVDAEFIYVHEAKEYMQSLAEKSEKTKI